MAKFLTLAVSGLASGAVYSLIAAGLTLSYSATGIFNFSYGAVAFASAFLYFQLNSGLHWSIVPAALVTILVFAPLLGLLLNVAVFRPLARATDAAKIMATVGLLIALPALTRFMADELINVFGFHIPSSADVNRVGFPSGIGPVPRTNWVLPGRVPFDSNQLVVFLAAAICAAGLWYLMRRTTLGLRMRAVVDRPSLAQARGVDDNRTSSYAWVIGMVLAGLAGVVGAPVFGSLNPATYTAVQFVAAAAAVLGGLRSIPLAYAGGLLLGMAQNLVFGYATFAKNIRGFNAAVPFVLLLSGLVFIARQRGRRSGAASDDPPPLDYLSALPRWRRAVPWVVATAFLVFYLTVLASDFWLGIVANGLALALVFLSFVIVTGLGGMPSLAQAALVTSSGLTAGLLINRYHWPFFPSLLAGVAVAVALGVVVALPGLRLGGLPFALATLALGFLGDNVLFAWDYLRNRQRGWHFNRPALGPLHLTSNRSLALFLLVIVGLGVLLVRNLQRSSSGRAIAAVQASEAAAATAGVDPIRTKLGLFALSAAVAGLGGVMLATFTQSISGNSYPTTVGLLWLAQVVLFGIRRPGAAVIAGIVSAVSPPLLNSGFHWPSFVPTWLGWNGTRSAEIPAILFGLGAVQLARDPDGVMAVFVGQNAARRLKRAARRERLGDTALRAVATEEAAVAADAVRHERELVDAGVLRSHGADAPVDAALSLHDVKAGYGQVEVLHGIGLALRVGEITALLGANGSGKSTLCGVISGLVPVTGGTITKRDIDLTRMPPYRRARLGVLVAPESRGIFPGLTVEENLVLRLDKSSERERAYERFPVLAQRRRLTAGSLSGGEQQMLTLAPLLIRPPEILVVDEPTLGLAPLVVADLIQLFGELRDLGVALLLVEEKARDVLEIADTVILLELGYNQWHGPRSDVDETRLTAAYLGRIAT